MKLQFKNASLVSAVNGTITIKDSTEKERTFTNASIISVNKGTIIIESKWEPKRGELIKYISKDNIKYSIFTYMYDNKFWTYGCPIETLSEFPNGFNRLKSQYCKNIHSISPVTPEEQKEFDDFCKSHGRIWNKEKLEWEKYKWKPTDGEIFFTVVTDYLGIYIKYTVWTNCETDQLAYNYGNCFKTQKEAQIKINQIKDLFKN